MAPERFCKQNELKDLVRIYSNLIFIDILEKSGEIKRSYGRVFSRVRISQVLFNWSISEYLS